MPTTTQATNNPVAHGGRIDRALSELIAIEPTGAGTYRVHGASGDTYAVDLRARRCTCPDREDWCKHLLRVAFERGAGIPGQCSDCAALPGAFPCADCYIGGHATLP